jgi:hypothetical protein
MADYIPFTEKLGNLTAICPDCGLIMHRVISLWTLSSGDYVILGTSEASG